MNPSKYISILALMLLSACQNPNVLNGDEDIPATTVLKGATVFDGTGNRIENGIVIIKEGRIDDIGSESIQVPPDAEIIDVSGKFITLGLVDAHVHYFQTGFFDSRPDVLDLRDSISYVEVQAYQKKHPERYHEAYLRSGVTAVYDVGGFPWSIEMQESAEKDLNAPHVAAAGPLITPASIERIAYFNTPGENVMVHLSSAVTGRKAVEQNCILGATGIKIWGFYPDDENFMNNIQAVAQEVEARGNKLIAHAERLEAAKAALEVGTKLLVHSVIDELIDEEFMELFRKNRAIYTPTLVVGRGYLKTMKAILGEEFEINDPNGVVDEKTRMFLEGAQGFGYLIDTSALRGRVGRFASALDNENSITAINLKKVFEAGLLVAVGTDAGNPGTLPGISIYDELEKMQEAGIPPMELIVMATRNGAMAMERIDDFGTLEKGKMADLIILEKDPSLDIANLRSITHVMRGGLLRYVGEEFR